MPTIRVHGIPAPGGSKRGFVVNGRANIVDDCKRNKPWRDTVAAAVLEVIHGPMTGPLRFSVMFIMPRPKSHYKKNGVIKPGARHEFPTKKPDRTKLLRSTEDALKGIAWIDDTQAVQGEIGKRYVRDGETCGALLVIERATQPMEERR